MWAAKSLNQGKGFGNSLCLQLVQKFCRLAPDRLTATPTAPVRIAARPGCLLHRCPRPRGRGPILVRLAPPAISAESRAAPQRIWGAAGRRRR